jgi:hypothetical protein
MGGGVKRPPAEHDDGPVCPAFVRATGASAARPAAPARSLETHLALVRLLAGLGQQDAARGLRERAWRRRGRERVREWCEECGDATRPPGTLRP